MRDSSRCSCRRKSASYKDRAVGHFSLFGIPLSFPSPAGAEKKFSAESTFLRKHQDRQTGAALANSRHGLCNVFCGELRIQKNQVRANIF